MLIIHDRIEKARLNGHRKPGELYLTGKLVNYQCCKIPLELPANTVPKPGLQPLPLSISQFPETASIAVRTCHEKKCSIFSKHKFAGMFWIPEKYYPGAAYWVSECRTEPVQIKIKRLHCGIEPGTWVMLAHRKAIPDYTDGAGGWINKDTGEAETAIKYKPGIFTMFQVDGIEYIVQPDFQEYYYNHDETYSRLKEITDLRDAGVTLITVIHDEDLSGNELEDIQQGRVQGYE